MQRINTWQDAYSTGEAELSLGDGLSVRLALGRQLTIDESAGRVIKAFDYANGREQLIYGDTGERDISGLLKGASGTVKLHRHGNLVDLQIDGVSPSDSNPSGQLDFLTLPQGFRPIGGSGRKYWMPYDPAGNSRSVFIFGGGIIRTHAYQATDSYRLAICYSTGDPWPTQLPGVAVGSIPA